MSTVCAAVIAPSRVASDTVSAPSENTTIDRWPSKFWSVRAATITASNSAVSPSASTESMADDTDCTSAVGATRRVAWSLKVTRPTSTPSPATEFDECGRRLSSVLERRALGGTAGVQCDHDVDGLRISRITQGLDLEPLDGLAVLEHRERISGQLTIDGRSRHGDRDLCCAVVVQAGFTDGDGCGLLLRERGTAE